MYPIKRLSGEKALAGIVRQNVSSLRDNTQGLAREIAALEELSGEIGQIVNTITAIADQTNLLALNAAIEAAGLENMVGRFCGSC